MVFQILNILLLFEVCKAPEQSVFITYSFVFMFVLQKWICRGKDVWFGKQSASLVAKKLLASFL